MLDEIEALEDPSMRAELLIELAAKFSEVPAQVAVRPFAAKCKVPACESDAYVFHTSRPEGTLDFHFAVENPQGVSAKALAQILQETASGAPLAEVAEIGDDVVYRLFGRGISMGKGMGLRSMVQMVRAIAASKLEAK